MTARAVLNSRVTASGSGMCGVLAFVFFIFHFFFMYMLLFDAEVTARKDFLLAVRCCILSLILRVRRDCGSKSVTSFPCFR